MDYIQQWQQNLKQASQEGNLRRLIDDAIYDLTPEILAMNLAQIDASAGFDDKSLHNPGYKGTYSKNTSISAFSKGLYKPAGSKYDFQWTGRFRSGFEILDRPTGYAIDSAGAYGSDGKTEFFEGYENMFGLDSANTATIENEVLYYVLEKSLNQIYG